MTTIAVDWRAECDCTRTGHAAAPSPGPDPGTCAECGDHVTARWFPELDETDHPTTKPTGEHHP